MVDYGVEVNMPSAVEKARQILEQRKQAREVQRLAAAQERAREETAKKDAQKAAQEFTQDYWDRSDKILRTTDVLGELTSLQTQFVPDACILPFGVDGGGAIALKWTRAIEEVVEGKYWGDGENAGYDEGYSYTFRRGYAVEVRAFDIGLLPPKLRLRWVDQMVESGLVMKISDGIFVRESFLAVWAYEAGESGQQSQLPYVIKTEPHMIENFTEPRFCRLTDASQNLSSLIAEALVGALDLQSKSGF